MHDVVVAGDHPRLLAVRSLDQRRPLCQPLVEVRCRVGEEAHVLRVAFALVGCMSKRSPMCAARIP